MQQSEHRHGYHMLKHLVLGLALAGASVTQAQQSVEFDGPYPLAPTGLAAKVLPEGPFHYATGEGMDITVKVVARLAYPTSFAFLPDGRILISTREGKLRLMENDQLLPDEIPGGPEGVFAGESSEPVTIHAYMDLALHPDFENNHYIYLSYSKPVGDGLTLAVGRGRWDGSALQDFEDIWSEPETRGPGRMTFGPEGKLYISVSGTGPQDLSTPGGKTLRINADGSIPQDNPFIDNPEAHDAIYTWGHRNGLGLTVHPGSGKIWQAENGPNGGDEINVLEPGANYGWPHVSLGRQYHGPWQSERPTHEGYEPPIVYWMPAIAVSGMDFYTGDALHEWTGDLFVGALRTGEIPGTGHIQRILFNENMEELRRESLLTDLRQRVRDVRQGPDGFIYVATDERDGAVLRIEPAQ